MLLRSGLNRHFSPCICKEIVYKKLCYINIKNKSDTKVVLMQLYRAREANGSSIPSYFSSNIRGLAPSQSF